MSSVYPINSQAWNTLAVNAGLIDLLTAIGYGVGSGVVSASLQIPFDADVTGVGTGLVNLGMTAPISGSGTAYGYGTADPTLFYYGAIPVLITDWDTDPGVSPLKIQTINWDQV